MSFIHGFEVESRPLLSALALKWPEYRKYFGLYFVLCPGSMYHRIELHHALTHLCRMDYSILTLLTGPFLIEGVLVSFYY